MVRIPTAPLRAAGVAAALLALAGCASFSDGSGPFAGGAYAGDRGGPGWSSGGVYRDITPSDWRWPTTYHSGHGGGGGDGGR